MERLGWTGLRVLSWVLLAAAVVSIVAHLVLDAGPDKEAPRWILYTAMFSALVAMALGLLRERQRRSRR